MKIAIAYVATALTFLVLDALWLGYVARDFYRAQLGGLLAENVNFGAAAAFYFLYVAGVLIFVCMPALDDGGWQRAALYGALLGLVAYGTYDLTNLAVAKGFPMQAALVDMTWGAVVTGISAAVGVMVAARF